MQIWIYTMASVMIVSLISFIGIITLALKPEKLKKIVLFLVSFAVGGLFGDALIHLIPQSFERLGFTLATSLCIIAGILFFFALERFLRWQHCHVPASSEHIHPVATLSLVGDAVHNFFDGLIIGASFMVSIPIGITTTLAVILHEIPQEIGNFGILVYGGYSVKKALFFNFLTALTSIAGGILSLLVGPYLQGYSVYLLPMTAGGFLYIAGSDLIPELHHGSDVKLSTSLWQFSCIILGVGLMSLLIFLEH